MEPEWLSYQAVADRLGITPEAARSRAKRLGWRRQMGNDGRALVWAALDPRPPDDRPVTARSPTGRKSVDPVLLTALRDHNETLKADIERLESTLAHERARADRAIAEFSSLADRLARLAEDRARPWWWRLARA